MVVVAIVKKGFSKHITIIFTILLIISTSGQKQTGMIYILQWTYTLDESWIYCDLQMDQEAFVSRNCSFQNCFITPNRSYFDSVQDFDVLLFNAVHLSRGNYKHDMPLNRSEIQLYVLVGFEPALLYPIPAFSNGFFNLTWTYKLTSDVVHPYFAVKNKHNEIIGPSKDINWMNITAMTSTDKSIVQKLQSKRTAAAWITNCVSTVNSVDNFIHRLNNELSKYNQRVDIYGMSRNVDCDRKRGEINDDIAKYHTEIGSDHYFYLAFENTTNEDYVTEKVLHGLDHYAVPVVYGGANYTRFLPDGIYLDALKLGEAGLAKEMNDIILDRQRYFNFFKWHEYYSFHATAEDHYRETVCELCAFLNKRTRKNLRTEYKDIAKWWNGELSAHIIATRSISDSLPGFFSNILSPRNITDDKPNLIMSLLYDILQAFFE